MPTHSTPLHINRNTKPEADGKCRPPSDKFSSAIIRSFAPLAATKESARQRNVRPASFSTWNRVLEGFYGPPEHGGNKDYASWKMVGSPEHSGTMVPPPV